MRIYHLPEDPYLIMNHLRSVGDYDGYDDMHLLALMHYQSMLRRVFPNVIVSWLMVGRICVNI